MKLSKLASMLFAGAGSILLVGAIVLCLIFWNRPAKNLQPPAEADDFARLVLDALDEGDFAAVEGYLHGKPTLGLDREPATAEGKRIWDAYRSSVTVTAEGTCRSEGTNIYQTAQVTAMDIPQTLSRLDQRAGELLKQKLEEQEDHSALLDEDGQVPQRLKDTLRTQALEEALKEPITATTRITFQLLEQDGQWWALPDQALLDILSGGRK